MAIMIKGCSEVIRITTKVDCYNHHLHPQTLYTHHHLIPTYCYN